MRLFQPFLIFFFSFNSTVYSQNRDTLSVGIVEGVAFDSLHNYVLRSATVAIYGSKDTATLISYQLTNNFGEFLFNNIPANQRLKIVISYVGYKSFYKTFSIPKNGEKISLGQLNLESGEQDLTAVTVFSTPPIRMNNDTLEFNPNAFKMDENAVVEDLLKKLPGITVWGDGTITVNGRQVKSVLVDGKPFFGGTTKVATQNIPKTAVEKIQVYQQNKDVNNLQDSTTEVNIKLKVNSNHGSFGKVGVGYGTNKRLEVDGNLNLFSPKTQFAFVGAGNNVNKIARNISTLINNSTYKGIGAIIDYQPDFRTPGSNRPIEAGMSFQHDFLEKNDLYNINRLSADYFWQGNNNNILTNTRTNTSLNANDILNQETQYSNILSTSQHDFNSRYQRKKNDRSIDLGLYFGDNKIERLESSSGVTYGDNNIITSQNTGRNTSTSDSKNLRLSGGYLQTGVGGSTKALSFKNIRLNYSISGGQDKRNQFTQSTFNSFLDPSKNQVVDRTYLIDKNYFNTLISINLDNIKTVYIGGLNIARIGIANEFSTSFVSDNNNVKDIDMVTGAYKPNVYLTNKIKYSTVNNIPSLNLKRNFSKTLTNRYAYNTEVSLLLRGQFFVQNNISEKTFQNFNRKYSRFIPQAGVKYSDFKFGRFQNIYSLDFTLSSSFPNPEQLVTLADSSNVYNINVGNPNLKLSNQSELSFNFSHTPLSNKSRFAYTLSIKAGTVNNNISDSTIVDKDGRYLRYYVNVNGFKYINATGSMNRAFKIRNHVFQVLLKSVFDFSKNINYFNSILNNSNSISSTTNLELYYYINTFLAVNVGQNLTMYKSQQTGANNRVFSNTIRTTNLSVSSSITKKLTIGTNFSYSVNTSSTSNDINFTIWNANASYRLFKQKNAEIKFSAFDLLRQNSNVINYGINNIMTRSVNNVLQQYFMFTFSFFPRNFGKNEKVNN